MNPFKRIRIRLGLTQVVLAEKLGMGQSNVSHYETGRQKDVPPDVAKKLVALGKSMGKRVTLAEIYGTQSKAKK